MSYFRFSTYTRDELVRCGESFKKDIISYVDILNLFTTYQWTDFVIHWFACAAPYPAGNSIITYAHEPRASTPWQTLCGDKEIARREPGPRNHGEFLLDLTHVDVEPMPVMTQGGWTAWATRIRLGLESEWGHQASPRYNIERVLIDAAKLAAVRAQAKVMIFASTNTQNRDDIVECLSRLRSTSDDSVPWLWFDIPWTWDRRITRWEPAFGLVDAPETTKSEEPSIPRV
ncbi:hypothetical protein [Sorangium cellulosum]|uniref:hypothetical protein n=1 Tax=Sorangium cellulosum TaxID=56 RepID=UPI0011DC7DA9|nr:hypothetical protein [Sorangium cellulosum]